MNALVVFLLLFVGVPLLELYVLIEVGSDIGAIPTIALSVFTAVLGAMLVRLQGLSVLFRVQQAMNRGEAPAIEMMEGAVLMLTGLLLLLPGFITDALGFLMLIPQVRRGLIVAYLRHSGMIRPMEGGGTRPQQPPGRRIIEGDYRREDDNSQNP